MLRINYLPSLAQATALAIAISITLVTPQVALAEAAAKWTVAKVKVTELKPNIKAGGRANTVAIHPNYPSKSTILVASESGGLFRSDDGGNTWQHVDNLPVFYTNAVAFLPSDPKIVIVTASEDFSASNHGGVWRSDNGGTTWKQVLWKDTKSGKIADGTITPNASWPCVARFSAYEISMAADNIYVGDNCGASISHDQGKTWTHVNVFGIGDQQILSVLALPMTAQGCDGHVASGNLVLAGGPSGIRRSPDGGQHWCVPKQGPEQANPYPAIKDHVIEDMHAFGRSPGANNQAYVVANVELDKNQRDNEKLTCDGTSSCTYTIVYSTNNGGDTWQKSSIPYSHPSDRDNNGGCGGIAFVKAVGDADSFSLYVSNRCVIYRLFHGASTWQPFIRWPDTSVAGDTRDLAFNFNSHPPNPILAATDGGLIKAPFGEDPVWTFAGANAQGNIPNGYNALQIYQVKGQWIGFGHYVYFGTQDNAIWSSNDSGNTWTRCCNEGGFFEGEYRVAQVSDSQITFHPHYVDPGGRLSAALFTCSATADNSTCDGGFVVWPKPKLDGVDCLGDRAPKIIAKNFHVQGVETISTVIPTYYPCVQGLAITNSLGTKWEQYATVDGDRWDLPRLSPVTSTLKPGTGQPPVLYQAIRIWDGKKETNHLARIVGKPCPSPSPLACVEYPDMLTCPATNTCPVTSACPNKRKFGSLGTGPTMERWYQIFDVDPDNVNHLIAADVDNNMMMETWNGGYCWTEIKQLTTLVTDGGKLNFKGQTFFNGWWRAWPATLQASAISFNPEHPDMVAVGTVQNGILVSADRGQNWAKLVGSERATPISSLHWRSANEIIASTYGRGLWRVYFNVVDKKDNNLELVLCKLCIQIYVQRPPQEQPSPFNEAVLAYGGSIEGARVVNGMLQEIFIRPGTSIAFASDSDEMPDIKVTETTEPVDFVGLRRVPKAPERAPIITALTLRKSRGNNELVGFVFAPNPRFMNAAKNDEAQERFVARRESPNAGRPYLEVPTAAGTSPGAAIRLGGRNLKPGSTIGITVDGRPVERVVVARDGRFSASVKAPSQFGPHRITIIDGATGRVLDERTVMVRPNH